MNVIESDFSSDARDCLERSWTIFIESIFTHIHTYIFKLNDILCTFYSQYFNRRVSKNSFISKVFIIQSE